MNVPAHVSWHRLQSIWLPHDANRYVLVSHDRNPD